jgi:hypothetical protein
MKSTSFILSMGGVLHSITTKDVWQSKERPGEYVRVIEIDRTLSLVECNAGGVVISEIPLIMEPRDLLKRYHQN